MNKNDLVDKIAEATDEPKSTVTEVVEATLAEITEALKRREKVQITGFGTFEARFRDARTARNPQTGAEIQVSARYAPAFKAGAALKETIQ